MKRENRERMENAERELVRRCARGEESAFRDLVERFEKPLIHFILRYVSDRSQAEDLFQETFIRVLRNIADFRPEATLSTWIFTIARNLCLDTLKARRRHREVSLQAPQRTEAGKVIDFRDLLREQREGPEADASGRELQERVQRALSKLPPAKREALVLRTFVGLSYEEIGKIAGSPVGTVKFRVHEAIRELTTLLRGTEEEREAETA